jgi:uncharacterized protein (TIGR02246 family)
MVKGVIKRVVGVVFILGVLGVIGVFAGGDFAQVIWAQSAAAPPATSAEAAAAAAAAQAAQAQAAGIAATAQSEANAAPAEDPNGVQFALKRYIVTFNSHDAAKLAALWTENAVYVDKATGLRTEGRAALTADFAKLFAASPEVVLSGDVEGIREIGADAAMVDGVSRTMAPDSEPSVSAFTAVFVRRDGKWLIDSVHETTLPTPETPRQALEPLAWMVGHWQDAGGGDLVDTNVRWAPGDAFLIRSYTAHREGEELPFAGTQVIGWDPRSKQIRSWTFNSDGSFGDGAWSKNGNEWLVRTTQTLADGGAASATQVITMVDADTAMVQTVGKEVNGAPEPASEPVTMVRAAEPEATPPTAGAPAGDAAAGTTAATATEAVQ